MDADLKMLMSPLALVCRRQVHGENGGATVHCVVLADGALIECGSDGYAPKRARLLADAVNAFGPERFDFSAHVRSLKEGK